MRAQKCTEGGFRERAEAQELPGRYRLTRAPAQHLHPPFHTATHLPELNQTKIGPSVPFGGSAATLTPRFHRPSPGKRNRAPRNGPPFPRTASLTLSDPPDVSLASSSSCVTRQDPRGDTVLPSSQGEHSSALPCLPGPVQQDNLPLHDPAGRISVQLSDSQELCLHSPIHVGRMSNSCSCTVWSSVYLPCRTSRGKHCLSNSPVALKKRQVTCRKRI